MNVPYELPDIFMVILITYNGTENHLIAAWSRVQPRIAPSSGEANCMLACVESQKHWGSFTCARDQNK